MERGSVIDAQQDLQADERRYGPEKIWIEIKNKEGNVIERCWYYPAAEYKARKEFYDSLYHTACPL